MSCLKESEVNRNIIIYLSLLNLSLVILSCSDDSKIYPDGNTPKTDSLPARNDRWINGNRWKMALTRYGYWARHFDGRGVFGAEFPSGSGHSAVYMGGLFIGAVKNGVPRVSEIEYQTDFMPGRITNSGPFSELRFSPPDSSPIYIINNIKDSPDWRMWPAQQGAPWDEVNQEPLLISNEDSWFVCHDLKGDSLEGSNSELGNGFGLELQRMTYMINGGYYFRDVVFIRYRFTNKSNIDYPEAYVSWWLDHNLGPEIYNDVIGTDTLRNMVYTYNLTIEGTGRQFSVGHQLLYFSEGGMNSRLTSSNGYANGGDPSVDYQRYNLMQGIGTTGVPYPAAIYGGAGGRFVYPGDPVSQTGALCKDGRNGRLMANLGPFTMKSGQTYDLMFAVIGGEADTPLNAVVDLRAKADYLKNVFFPLAVSEFRFK